MLAKELDLAAYLGASDVVRVMAVVSGNAINVLAKLANDVNVSVEISAALPKGEASAGSPAIRRLILILLMRLSAAGTVTEQLSIPMSIRSSLGFLTMKFGMSVRHSRFSRNVLTPRSGKPLGQRRRRPRRRSPLRRASTQTSR